MNEFNQFPSPQVEEEKAETPSPDFVRMMKVLDEAIALLRGAVARREAYLADQRRQNDDALSHPQGQPYGDTEEQPPRLASPLVQ